MNLPPSVGLPVPPASKSSWKCVRWFLHSSLLCFLLLKTGCSGFKINEDDPASLMQDAEAEIEGQHYLLALEKLQKIATRFPYSHFSADAKLRKADVYFYQESFTEAAMAYELFQELHPKHPKASYAAFQTAEAYRSEMPSQIARDLTSGQKAEKAYENYLKKYSQTPEAEEAKQNLYAVREHLAQKELLIARFYSERGFTQSAERRYTKIIQTYPDTPTASLVKQEIEKKTVSLSSPHAP